MKSSHSRHREDPVQSHTPPSTASSSPDLAENTYRKEYVDPKTGKYVEETIIETRDPNNKHRKIRKHKVRRRSVSRTVATEEASGDGYSAPPQPVYPYDSISSTGSRGRSRRDKFEEDSYSDRSVSPPKRQNSLSRALAKLGLVGAAAEAKHKHDEHERRRSLSRGRSDYATTDASSRGSSISRSRSRKRDRHLKEGALIGLGAVAAEHEHKKHKREKNRSRSRHSGYYTSDGSYSDSDDGHHRHRGRRHSESDLTRDQHEQAAKTALITAAVQAWRNRKLPGGLRNEQGIRRVVEAAIASGAFELMMDKKKLDENRKRRMVEAVIGGLVSQRVIEGSSKNGHFVARPHHKSHVRSRSRGPMLAELAAGGAAIYAGKKVYDRSRSRRRAGSRSPSPDRHGRPRIDRRRSKSIPALLGAVGLGSVADNIHHRLRGDSRSRSRNRSDNSRRRTIGMYEGDRELSDRDPGDGVRGDGYGAAAPAGYAAMPRSQTMPAPQGELSEYGQRGGGGSDRGDRGDRGDREKPKAMSEMSDDDPNLPESELKKRRKKKKQREIVTAALAVLGIVGAAQKLYEGQEAHKLRREMVIEGEISKEEATRKRRKAKLKEGAALGLAGLAMWEMYDDGKKAYENHKDRVCFEENCRHRHNRVGEHVGDEDKKDGKPSGDRRRRKGQKKLTGGENNDYYDPNVQYAQYPDGPPVQDPNFAGAGARGAPAAIGVPVAPAYPAGIAPAGGRYVSGYGPAPVYSAPPPVARATMKDGRQMTVVYPDQVSQVQ